MKEKTEEEIEREIYEAFVERSDDKKKKSFYSDIQNKKRCGNGR